MTTTVVVTDSAIPSTVPVQVSLSRIPGFPGIPQAGMLELDCLTFPSPGDLPDPRIDPLSPALQADSLPSEPPGKLFQLLSTWQNKNKLFNICHCIPGYIHMHCFI